MFVPLNVSWTLFSPGHLTFEPWQEGNPPSSLTEQDEEDYSEQSPFEERRRKLKGLVLHCVDQPSDTELENF